MKKLLALAAVLSLLAAPALAEDKAGKMEKKQQRMEMMDKDNDKSISRSEFNEFHETKFSEADKNSDGKLDMAEWEGMMKDKHKSQSRGRFGEDQSRSDSSLGGSTQGSSIGGSSTQSGSSQSSE